MKLFFTTVIFLIGITSVLAGGAGGGGGGGSGCGRSFLIAPQLEYSGTTITNQSAVSITGATEPCGPMVVNMYNNGIFISSGVVSGTSTETGSFNLIITLNEGENLITANEVSGTGLSIDSNTISITKDTTSPTISITSHSNNDTVTGSQLYLSGVFNDTIGIARLYVDNESITFPYRQGWGGGTSCIISLNPNTIPPPSFWGSSNYKTVSYVTCGTLTGATFGGLPLNLTGGMNVIRYTGFDTIANPITGTINIFRKVISSNLDYTLSGVNTANIEFYNDYESEGIVLYGTSSGNLNLSGTTSCVPTSNVVSSIGLPPESKCSINLNGLNSDTTYYYQGYGSFSGVIGESTPIKSFKTPAIISQTSSGVLIAIGSAYLSGSTSTGMLFIETGTLLLSNNEGQGNTNVLLSLSGLTISSSGAWDGIFYAPVVTNDTATGVESGYSFTGNVYQIGNPSVELTLSGQSATINLFVGTHLNGQTLKVYRSINFGTSYSVLTTCIVSSGICSFSSSQFSLFTVAVATVIPPVAVSYGGGGGGGSILPIVSSVGVTGTGLNIIPVKKITTAGSIIESIVMDTTKFKKSRIIQFKSSLAKGTNITVFRVLPNGRMIKSGTTKVLRNGSIRYVAKSPGIYKFIRN